MVDTTPDPRAFLIISREHALWSIQLADMKANVLMAASAILAGLLVPQSVPACIGGARYVLFLAVGLALSGAGSAVLTLVPRIEPLERPSMLYYRTALEYANRDDYYAKVRQVSAGDTDRELAAQTWELARIQDRKYTWLRRGFLLFGLCLVATLIGTVWAHTACP